MKQQFGQCAWPVWKIDDFTSCFRNDYLKVLLPLAVIGLSFALLVLSSITRAIRSRRSAYSAVPTHENTAAQHTDVPLDEEDAIQDEEDEGLEIGGGRLALVRTTTKGSIVQADAPPAQTMSLVVEELAICGLVAINVIALLSSQSGLPLPAIAGLATWLYVLMLASLRLFLGNTQWRVPRLWNHTATIYGVQWLAAIVLFRSALLSPPSRLAQILSIVNFSLVTVLFILTVTNRKGNKTVLLEWEGDIEPSREPLASLFSLATFTWVDPIIWRGYKETMEMKSVWNLLPKDKAASVLSHYRQAKKTTSLALHLLKYFKGRLLVQALYAVLSGLFTFAPTLLLRAILEYVENPELNLPVNVIWLYVILFPLSDMVRSFGDGMALWIGRKICIQIRAIIVGEIYAKALRRKAASGKDKVLGQDKKKAADETKEGKLDKLKRLIGLGKKKDDKKAAEPAEPATAPPANGTDSGKDKDKDKKDDEQANLGTIINLMSVDSFKVAEITAYLHYLCASAPTQLTVATLLLYQVMGWSAIPGFVVMFFLVPVNYLLARGFHSTSKAIMTATDKRINITNEILQNIRIIKYFAWEERFGSIVNEKRAVELKALRSRYILWAFAVAIWNSVPVLITFSSFLFYTLIEKKPLYPSIAFTSISLFLLLRVPLDQLGDMIAHIQETKVSIDRVEEFLMEDETEKYEQLGTDNVDENGNKVIGFRDATFIWGGKDVVAEDGSMAFRLLDLNVDFKIGKLNIIAGPTGSGKSSMIMALLGEMTAVSGRVYLPGGRSREDVRPDPDTGLADCVAYVAQTAWLVNANIKENILFAAPYDEKRYKDVIVACALERDLEIWDSGDETLVGEKGITLSGGQKQRISLARALYSNAQHVLLDDCLSAVDSHTAQWIFSNCIKGPLMAGRTCILVSHNLQLCVPSSEYVVLMENGRVTAQGPSQEMIASGKLGDEVQKAVAGGSAAVSRIPSRVPSSVGDESAETAVNKNGDAAADATKAAKKKAAAKDAMEESKATGAVKWPVLKVYLTAMGPWWFWLITFIVFGMQQLASVATSFWVREWSNQYTTEEVSAGGLFAHGSGLHSYNTAPMASGHFPSLGAFGISGSLFNSSPQSQANVLADAKVNVLYYLTVLAVIGLAGAVVAVGRDLWLFYGSLTASRKIHERLMLAVTRAKFKFFDVTPLGQLMNRFSKDLEAVDQEVAGVATGALSCGLALIITIILIAYITPGFLIAGVFITIGYYFIGTFYLSASRDLKRLESVQRSPLFQQFGETLTGMTTIRAYGDERRWIRENLAKINAQSRPFIFLWACNRWLAFRADLFGDLVTFFAGVFIILSLGQIDAGAVGISLSYATQFTDYILWLVRLYAMNEQNMNSVERIKEYLDVEQEAPAVVEKNRPPKSWPAQGRVEFVNYSARYRAELEPVLRGLTFTIQAHEKVGIVGRTGAGKSSLALAVFRALEADSGSILIDGLDIGRIGLRDLREAITIVPQDPTLFAGTLRSNLDPFDSYTDDEIFDALRRVQLIGDAGPASEPASAPATMAATPVVAIIPPPGPLISVSADGADASADAAPATPTSPAAATNKNIFLDLASTVAESGSNLSQGQRQLLCLARALLRRPSVLVMDEATASIDYATDAKIQGTLRAFAATTVTIAHRLQTIADYDKVLVLDRGEVVEFGHPYELMRKAGGAFRSMCESGGEFEALLQTARRAAGEGTLIDIEDEEPAGNSKAGSSKAGSPKAGGGGDGAEGAP